MSRASKLTPMQWVRNVYGVPATRGMRVECDRAGQPQLGTIKSARGGHLRVQFDGESMSKAFHPSEIRYLGQLDAERVRTGFSIAYRRVNGSLVFDNAGDSNNIHVYRFLRDAVRDRDDLRTNGCLSQERAEVVRVKFKRPVMLGLARAPSK